MTNIKIIFAQSLNGIIGKDGGLPWHLSDDLKEFKEKTIGHTVIMGRKTWDSLPNNLKPLPHRTNIIVSNNRQFAFDIVKTYGSYWSFANKTNEEYYQCTRVTYDLVHTLKNRFDLDENIWIIGGKSIYELALPYAKELHITTVMINAEGDTTSPDINFDDFNLIYQSRIKYDSKTNIPYYTTIYRKK